MRPLVLLFGALAGLVAATQALADTDMWWHLALGRDTLATGFVRADTYSWTVRGSPVSTDQWLGQVLMWLSYSALGWHGVAMLRVALVVALIACVALGAMRRASRQLAVVLSVVPALLITRAVWVDRPELMGFVLFAALLLVLPRVRDGSARAMALAVVLAGVWANVHGSFALGAVLVAIVCAEAALRDAARRGRYTACAIAVFAITLANPAGLGVWTAPGVHLLSPPRDIQEWSVIDPRTPLGIAYVLTLALVIACAFTGPRLSRAEAAVLVPVALLSLTAARQAPLLAIAAAPLFAERANAIVERYLRAPEPSRAVPFASFAAGALLLATALAALAIAPSAPDERAYPVAAIASIPPGDRALSRYEWGGWLIWRGVPVFVDGRLTPYFGGVLDDYKSVMTAAPGWQDVIARRGVRLLYVTPADPVAQRAMELGWAVRHRSETVIVIAVP